MFHMNIIILNNALVLQIPCILTCILIPCCPFKSCGEVNAVYVPTRTSYFTFVYPHIIKYLPIGFVKLTEGVS